MCSLWTTAEGVCPLSEMQRAREISRERDAPLSGIGQKQGRTVAILHVTNASCHFRFMCSVDGIAGVVLLLHSEYRTTSDWFEYLSLRLFEDITDFSYGRDVFRIA